MSVRGFSIFAAVLTVGAVGVWLWSGKDGSFPTGPAMGEKPAGADISRQSPGSVVPDPASSAAPLTPGAGLADAPPEPVKPAEPIRVASSVVPGMPMVRGGSSPQRPPAAAGPAGVGVASPAERDAHAKSELTKVQAMLRDFRTRMGENPVGSNAEIMKAVMGGNSAGATLGPPEGQEVNEAGELLDMWGTPIFFHQLSKKSMEVHSAGPDRKMWTADDVQL